MTCRLVWARPLNLNVDPYASGYGIIFISNGPLLEGSFIKKQILAKYITDYVAPISSIPLGGTFFGPPIPPPPPPPPEVFNDPLDDNESSRYFLPSINPLTGIPRYVICPGKIKYEILNDGVSRFLQFDKDTGFFSGIMPDIDYFISDASFQKFDSTNYAQKGSASFFSGGRGVVKRIFLKVRAYLESNPSIFLENDFYLDVMNNWSSDRDALISGPRSIEDVFHIEGLPATKEQYLSYMKSRGYFNS